MNARLIDVRRIGRTPYRECWDLQRELVRQCQQGGSDVLLLTEHDHVYTIGTAGSAAHVLADRQALEQMSVGIVTTDRGGDITYHGPGQLVGYPILDLHHYTCDLHRYLRDLEEVIIRTLAASGVTGSRDPRYTGVWVGDEKICAIGIRTSRWVTMHGFALNVNTDLSYFKHIIPCGIPDKGVTSLLHLVGETMDVEYVTDILVDQFLQVFDPVPVRPVVVSPCDNRVKDRAHLNKSCYPQLV